MTNKKIFLWLSSLVLLMAFAMFLVTKDESSYGYDVKETIEYFNQRADVHFYISGNVFDNYF